jgi:hypothetical protein
LGVGYNSITCTILPGDCSGVLPIAYREKMPSSVGATSARELGDGVSSAQYGPMRNTSVQFRKPVWQDWHGNQQPVPPALRRVAKAFVDLQDERHTFAFQDWRSIRTMPMAGNYLLAVLLRKQR